MKLNFFLSGAFLLTGALISANLAALAEEPAYGPNNLLKTVKTPFGSLEIKTKRNAAQASSSGQDMTLSIQDSSMKLPIDGALKLSGSQPSSKDTGSSSDSFVPIGIASPERRPIRRSLSERLVPWRLFMPGRLIIGSPAEFSVKGPAGYKVAIAMADRNSGSKPVFGHNLRLGPDRKLIAVETIPDSGVATLVFDMPIEGDLIGQYVYFEAAIWSRDDFSDMRLAETVPSVVEKDSPINGVLVSGMPPPPKKGIKKIHIVPMSTPIGPAMSSPQLRQPGNL